MELNELRALILSQNLRWEAGITSFSRLSLERKRMLLGAVPPRGAATLVEREKRASSGRPPNGNGNGNGHKPPPLPQKVDWRSQSLPGQNNPQNWVTPIENQLNCGSCVAFGTVGCFESHVRISQGNSNLAIDLSEADLWFCFGPSHGAGKCPDGGWWPDQALPGLEQGIVDAACFPYTPADQPCSRCADWGNRLSKISAWQSTGLVADMREFLANRGPMITCFTVYDDFYNYIGGVYSPSNSQNNAVVGGHCVCVVGYDVQNSCWICKNSWGNSFGENGFFRIQFSTCGVDAEMWSLEVGQTT